MVYCAQVECLYLSIWEKLSFALGVKGYTSVRGRHFTIKGDELATIIGNVKFV